MIHASVAFCGKHYYSKRLRPAQGGSAEYKNPSQESEVSEQIGRLFDLTGLDIEMDVFNDVLFKGSDILDNLGWGTAKYMGVYHLVMATASGFSPCVLTFQRLTSLGR